MDTVKPDLPKTCPEHDEETFTHVAHRNGSNEVMSEQRDYRCGCSVSMAFVGPPQDWMVDQKILLKAS